MWLWKHPAAVSAILNFVRAEFHWNEGQGARCCATCGHQKVRVFYERKAPHHMLFCSSWSPNSTDLYFWYLCIINIFTNIKDIAEKSARANLGKPSCKKKVFFRALPELPLRIGVIGGNAKKQCFYPIPLSAPRNNVGRPTFWQFWS